MHLFDKEKRIIIKNECVQVNLFLGDAPYALGHIVIELMNNVHDITDLKKDDWKNLSNWIPRVTNAMKKVLKEVIGRVVAKIYICSFNEDEKYNVHFHLIPRYECIKQLGPDLLRPDEKLIISPQIRDNIVHKMKIELAS